MPAENRIPPFSLASCLIFLFSALPASVLSQQTALEEVIVTAQKREQGINDVGITVNAFTAAQLENYGVRSAEDLETITPGLTVTDAQPHGVPVYTIRGVGFADYTTSASSTVGLYFDEVNLPYAVMTRGVLFDVERVEVLKGPQGDLYGRNSTAGQINFVSRKPTEEFAGGIKLGYSRFDVIDAEAYVSGPLTDKARARVAVKTTQSAGDGWQKSLSRPGDRLGEYDDIAVRGLLDLDISDNASLFINLHWYEDNSDNMAPTPFDGTTIGLPTSLALPTPGNIVFSEGKSRAADWSPDLPPKRDNTLKGVSAKLDWDFGGVNLTTISSYDKFDRDETFDPSGVGFEDADVLNTTDLEVFSQEIRLSSNNDSNLYWLVGAHYSWDDMSESYILFMDESFFAFFGNPPGLDIDTAYDQTTEAFAGFGHIEYEFATNFRLTLGARYTDEKREWSGCTYDTGDGSLGALWNFILTPFVMIPQGFPDPGPLLPGGCGIYDERAGSPTFGQLAVFSDEISTDRWMWKVTLDYSPVEDVLLYGTVSKGFKSGGFNGAAAQTHTQLLPYTAETLTSYEAGIKSALFDGRLQLNLAGFYYDYEDKQEPTVAVTPVGNISGLTNVPESEAAGVELEAHWLVTTGLTLDLGVAWLNTEIKEYEAVDELASAWPNEVRFDASGSDLGNSPPWQVNGTLTYEWPVSSGLNMKVAGDFSYKDDNDGARGVQPPISDYFLVNARAGISAADDRWSVTVWGRNIFNHEYWLSTSTSNCCFVRMNGMPATYGVSLDYNF